MFIIGMYHDEMSILPRLMPKDNWGTCLTDTVSLSGGVCSGIVQHGIQDTMVRYGMARYGTV